MQKIVPNLWFDTQAQEAANFYCTIHKNSKIIETTYYDEDSSRAAKMPIGSVMTVKFEIEGQQFVALNGGPQFKFSEAVSFIVRCKNQDEIDYFWMKLTASGGEAGYCGWCKDRFGLSWQVVPASLEDMVADHDPEKHSRVMAAIMSMRKFDIATLEAAYKGEPVHAG